jgi:hypothetical protein
MLFMELVKAGGDWLWHNDRIGSRPELAPDCLDEFVVERAKGMTKNIGNEVEPTALCDSLPWMMIVAEDGWILAPSFSWTQGISEYCAVVGIIAMVHAIQRLECEWASVATAASTWHAPSLVMLV